MEAMIEDGWSVVTAWAEKASGSGWINRIVWVLLQRRGTNQYRVECLQPEEQGAETRLLFNVSALVSAEMGALAGRDLELK
jgi:hypothetical protein